MAITSTQKVLTLDYWKIAQDIKPGDIVFNRLGKKVRVKLVQILDKRPCFRATFLDGTSVAGDKDLKFPIETPKYRNRIVTYKGVQKFRRPLLPKAISELTAEPLVNKNNRLKFSVPTTAPLELPYKDLPVPPFLFGFWFFTRRRDGTIKIPSVYMDLITEKLKEQQRIELLSGIMHSKPRRYNKKSDTFRFTSQHFPTVKQVQYLAESLGCKTVLEGPDSVIGYTVHIKTKLKLMDEQTPKPIKVRQNWRMLSKIEPITPQACVHIELDGEDNSMLVEEGFIACL